MLEVPGKAHGTEFGPVCSLAGEGGGADFCGIGSRGSFHTIMTKVVITTCRTEGIHVPKWQEEGEGEAGEMLRQRFVKHTPSKCGWVCVFHSGDVLRRFIPSPHPPSRADSSQRCWFLSCDHYGNLASFLLLIYDLVNMPACQMVLFFRLGDNEINKNCCKKQREGGFFLNGPLLVSTNVLGRPLPQLWAPRGWQGSWCSGGLWEVSCLFCALEFCPQRDRASVSPAQSAWSLNLLVPTALSA